MQTLKAALSRQDPDAEVFFAPDSLRAGGFWQKQLAEQIAKSTVFALLVGEKLGDWQVMEYYEALDRRARDPNYPVILLLSEEFPAPGLPFARQLHWIVTADPASEASVARLVAAASGPAERPSMLWQFTRPYRGLEAMTEANSGYFFGRGQETIDLVNALASERGKVTILLGDSGVGKSSLAQAGVMAALLRQGWPEQIRDAPAWPPVFDQSRHWCFLTLRPGPEPIRALVEQFIRAWFDPTDPRREARLDEWTQRLRDGDASLRGLLDATRDRLHELGQEPPPAFFLYVDQGEELYVLAPEPERRRFSEILKEGIADPRLRAMMSMRIDFLRELLNDEALYAVHRQINIPPLREPQLREVVSKPPELLSAQFERPDFVDLITRQAVADGGALPLLSYTLDDMWDHMVRRGDGVLRLAPNLFALGGVLVDRAEKFLNSHPHAEAALRRIFTLRCATVHEDGEPTRRRAPRSEFSDEWPIVSQLANAPYRLLVTATTEGGETYAEVAHESIFKRWHKLREWVDAEKEFLSWRKNFEAMRRRWEDERLDSALLMGIHLTDAQKWLKQRPGELSAGAVDFISRSAKLHAQQQAKLDYDARWRREEDKLKKEVEQTIRGFLDNIKRTIGWPPVQ